LRTFIQRRIMHKTRKTRRNSTENFMYVMNWKCNNMLGNNQQKLDVTSSFAYTNNHVSSLGDVWLWVIVMCIQITHPIKKIDITCLRLQSALQYLRLS
jgi:hypothetical protein